VSTSAPARPATFIGDVLVPGAQAAITGSLVGAALTIGVALFTDYEDNLLALWLGLALGITTLAWVILLLDHRRLLWAVERLTGVDIDQDGSTGKPGAHLVWVNRQKANQRAEEARREAEWLIFLGFISRLGVKGTALATWEKELGRDRYNEFRDALVDYGLAKWRSYNANGRPNTSQGWELVGTPEETLAQLEIERA
jgi:hypothetical protein